jgi:hypothetical protein
MEKTITLEKPDVDEALGLIDKGLGDMLHREIVSTAEVSDLLLDVRLVLAGVKAAQLV